MGEYGELGIQSEREQREPVWNKVEEGDRLLNLPSDLHLYPTAHTEEVSTNAGRCLQKRGGPLFHRISRGGEKLMTTLGEGGEQTRAYSHGIPCHGGEYSNFSLGVQKSAPSLPFFSHKVNLWIVPVFLSIRFAKIWSWNVCFLVPHGSYGLNILIIQRGSGTLHKEESLAPWLSGWVSYNRTIL